MGITIFGQNRGCRAEGGYPALGCDPVSEAIFTNDTFRVSIYFEIGGFVLTLGGGVMKFEHKNSLKKIGQPPRHSENLLH